MAEPHNLVALVTVLSIALFVWMGLRVMMARGAYAVPAPATTGHPEFERHHRVHVNTLEGLVMYLPALWLFALYWNDRLAAALGAAWIIGRVLYMYGYVADPRRREVGFIIQFVATLILLIGAGAGAVRALIATGGV